MVSQRVTNTKEKVGNRMMEPEFMNVPLIEREARLMPEIIRCLRNLGGFASRKQLIKEMKDTSQVIPEDYIDFQRVSKRSGEKYKPFNFQFNFAVKHLIYANYIISPNRGDIELTEKGRNVDLENFDVDTMVRAISDPLFLAQSQRNKENKEITKLTSMTEDEIIEVEKEDGIVEVEKEDEWKDQLSDSLKRISPRKFELFARRLVNAMGVDLDENIGVQYVADGGLDGFGYITSDDFRTTRVAIQAKRWQGKVSSPEIDKFRGAMDKFNAEFGIFITTSDFTRDAITASRIGTRVITLINGDRIAELVAQYKLYVTPVTTYELGDFYLEEE